MTVPDTSTGREYERGDAGPDRRPATSATEGPTRRAVLPRTAAFWLVAAVLFLLFVPGGERRRPAVRRPGTARGRRRHRDQRPGQRSA